MSVQEPREMKEINLEYQQLCANAGQCQYQIRQFSKQLEQFNEQLEVLNKEASARNDIDKSNAAKTEVTNDQP